MGSLVLMIFAVAGTLCGFFCLPLAERVVVFKCKKKGREVPQYYWGTEEKTICMLMGAVLFVAVAYCYPRLQAVFLCVFSIIAIIGTLIDHRIRIIPNELVISVFILGIFFNLTEGGVNHICLSVLSSVITFSLFLLTAKITYHFVKSIGVGAGDVKLASAASFVLGIERLSWFFLGIVIALTTYLLIGLWLGKIKVGSTFPMGGQIMAGFIAAFLLPVLLPLI